MRTVERGHLSRDFQPFVVDMAANQRVNKESNNLEYVCSLAALAFLTLPVEIQKVGMAVSAYWVDCCNIACRSCCG